MRWARHNPGTAVLGGVLTAVLVLATVASLLAAGYFKETAQSERDARHEAEEARDLARRRGDAERWERYRSNIAAASAALQLQNSGSCPHAPRRCAGGTPQLGMAVPPQPARRSLASCCPCRAGRILIVRPQPVGPADRRLLRSTITSLPVRRGHRQARRRPPRSLGSPCTIPWRTVLTASKLLPAATTRPSASGIRRRANKCASQGQKIAPPTWSVTPSWRITRTAAGLPPTDGRWDRSRRRHEPVVGRHHRQGDRRPGEMAGERHGRSPLAPMASGWPWVPGNTSTCATPSPAASSPSWALTRTPVGLLAYSPDGKRIASASPRRY